MTWTVRVVPDAEAEFEAGARWYDERAGLRAEFAGSIDEAIRANADQPLRHPRWPIAPAYRRLIVRRFPYLVFYRVRVDHVEIMAFAHTRRRQGYWIER